MRTVSLTIGPQGSFPTWNLSKLNFQPSFTKPFLSMALVFFSLKKDKVKYWLISKIGGINELDSYLACQWV